MTVVLKLCQVLDQERNFVDRLMQDKDCMKDLGMSKQGFGRQVFPPSISEVLLLLNNIRFAGPDTHQEGLQQSTTRLQEQLAKATCLQRK